METLNRLLDNPDDRNEQLFYAMEEDDDGTDALTNSFSNSLTISIDEEGEKTVECDAASLLLVYLNDAVSNYNPPFDGPTEPFLVSGVQGGDLILNCVAETTEQYHRVRTELSWCHRRKTKLELKMGEQQIKGRRDGELSRKRVLVTSDDPITEFEKKRALLETRLIEKRKELMHIVKELVLLKTQRPSLKLSALIKDAEDEFNCTPTCETQPRQPSTNRINKKKKDELNYAYPGSLITTLKGQSNLEALIQSVHESIADVRIDYTELQLFGPMLGKGAYGEVYSALWGARVVAVKKLPLVPLEHRRYVLNTFQREVQCFKAAKDNPHVVKFYGACLLPEFCCIVMEYIEGGSLYDLIFKQGFRVGLRASVRIALDIAKGMELLHKRSEVVHRDLNLSNVLVHRDILAWDGSSTIAGWILISDFSPVGHPRYRAPELFDIDATYTTTGDSYSFGILLYELLERTPIYAGLEDKEVSQKILAQDYPVFSEGMPTALRQLMLSCWQQKPKRRPSFKRICKRLEKVLAAEPSPIT